MSSISSKQSNNDFEEEKLNQSITRLIPIITSYQNEFYISFEVKTLKIRELIQILTKIKIQINNFSIQKQDYINGYEALTYLNNFEYEIEEDLSKYDLINTYYDFVKTEKMLKTQNRLNTLLSTI